MTFISVIAGTFNEEDNIIDLYNRITNTFKQHLKDYSYELLIIDNASTDRTVDILKQLAVMDKRVKIIVNNRNFGHVRSGYHALLQAKGDATIAMASDLQDPPEMIPQFVKKWEEGYKIVLAQKTNSAESPFFFLVRKIYYSLASRMSETELEKNVTGFGIYDRRVIEDIRQIGDPYPYFRGLICELGYERALIPFKQPTRKRGLTKNDCYALGDLAMLGITNHSKVPL
ncbi:MAG: glycosyltransferase family 2 protein, partial [Methylococcaceae bacterium]